MKNKKIKIEVQYGVKVIKPIHHPVMGHTLDPETVKPPIFTVKLMIRFKAAKQSLYRRLWARLNK